MSDAKTHRDIGDGAWVDFKPSGYPFSLQRRLREERNDAAVLGIITPYITACKLPLISGEWLDGLQSAADFDDVDESVIVQVIRAFFEFRAERMYSPASPNSSPPSPSM